MAKTVQCTICGGQMAPKYQKTILRKYKETLFQCGSADCGHLRFAGVHWLQEAYSRAIASLDTGAVRRCLSIRKTLYLLLFCIYGLKVSKIRMIDYGGGPGLLARLLRDVGVDCRTYDKYCDNIYCSAFNATEGGYDALSMIEVAEHIENPADEFRTIIGKFRPDFMFISTQLFKEGVGEDWWYFTPSTGQHISFFTRESMALLANQCGYRAYFVKKMIVWARNGVKVPACIHVTAVPLLQEVVFMVAAALNRYSSQKDFNLIEGRPNGENSL